MKTAPLSLLVGFLVNSGRQFLSLLSFSFFSKPLSLLRYISLFLMTALCVSFLAVGFSLFYCVLAFLCRLLRLKFWFSKSHCGAAVARCCVAVQSHAHGTAALDRTLGQFVLRLVLQDASYTRKKSLSTRPKAWDVTFSPCALLASLARIFSHPCSCHPSFQDI